MELFSNKDHYCGEILERGRRGVWRDQSEERSEAIDDVEAPRVKNRFGLWRVVPKFNIKSAFGSFKDKGLSDTEENFFDRHPRGLQRRLETLTDATESLQGDFNDLKRSSTWTKSLNSQNEDKAIIKRRTQRLKADIGNKRSICF